MEETKRKKVLVIGVIGADVHIVFVDDAINHPEGL
jgi:hypothetical protein